MVIVTVIYLALVYLLFFKLQLLPWNKITQGLTVLIGVILLMGFLVGLQGLAPSSSEATITGRIVEIAPQVSGRVETVPVAQNETVEAGTPLFTIDPTLFEARVEDLKAQLKLARLRLEQYEELAAKSAGSEFQLQQSQAENKELEAQLAGAQFDLDNTVVRAPARGLVPRLVLQPGMQVSAMGSVLTFVDTSQLAIMGKFQQKALPNVHIGDKAFVNFPALPGRVFETTVIAVPSAIGDVQIIASGQLPVMQDFQVTRQYPIFLALPADFPEGLHKVGLAATVYIHTEGGSMAGIVGSVATILQWIGTSLDAIT